MTGEIDGNWYHLVSNYYWDLLWWITTARIESTLQVAFNYSFSTSLPSLARRPRDQGMWSHGCHMHISQTLALPRISCPGVDGTVVSDDARQEIAGFQKVEKKQSTRPATCFITCIDRNVEAGLRHSRPAKPKRRSSKLGSRSELLVY